MGDYTEKVAASVASSLQPCERVVAATPAAPRGTMQSMARGDGPRPGPHAHPNRYLAAGHAQLDAIGVPFAPQYVLVCTNLRFVWFRTSMLGRPKGFAGSIPRGDVDA